MLSGPAIIGSKDGSSLWRAWNSRLVSVSLKVLYKQRVSKFYLFPCYAPTYAASREEKDSFFAALQEATYFIYTYLKGMIL